MFRVEGSGFLLISEAMRAFANFGECADVIVGEFAIEYEPT